MVWASLILPVHPCEYDVHSVPQRAKATIMSGSGFGAGGVRMVKKEISGE